MRAPAARSRLGSRGNPQQSRAAILHAAVREFAREGIAGARTDAIARSARVNKALLYYYFKDKEALYVAVLDQVFGGVNACIQQALAQPLPPRQRLLAYVAAHFDYIAGNPLYPRIVQGEMMRAGRANSAQFETVVRQYFRPVFTGLSELLREGMDSGDFRRVNPWHFIPAMVSVIVFHFNTGPVLRALTGRDPLDPELIAERRQAVLDFMSAALFRTPQGERA